MEGRLQLVLEAEAEAAVVLEWVLPVEPLVDLTLA